MKRHFAMIAGALAANAGGRPPGAVDRGGAPRRNRAMRGVTAGPQGRLVVR